MKKIAIYVCGDISKTCTGNGCLKALNNAADSFKVYEDTAIQLVSFNACNGCDQTPIESLKAKIVKFKKAEVDVVHLSTCIRGRCEHYETFKSLLKESFEVVGYTHGSEIRKVKIEKKGALK